MAGIRIFHPTARSATATFEHNNRPYRKYNRKLKKYDSTPMWCPVCAKFHLVKTYHVRVDENGFAFVSVETWEMMKRHTKAGFELANEVPNPPSITVGGSLGKATILKVGE